MDEPGEIYRKWGVEIGDHVEFEIAFRKKSGIVISPKDVDSSKNFINGDKFLYYICDIAKKQCGYSNIKNLKILKKHNEIKNETKQTNNCPECNVQGEYINGAFKCPKCWRVW